MLVACNGGGGDGDPASAATRAPAPGPTTTAPAGSTGTTGAPSRLPPADAADTALAARLLLRARDLPGVAGWSARRLTGEEIAGARDRLDTVCPEVAGAADRLDADNGREPGRAQVALALGTAGLPAIRHGVAVAADAERAGAGFTLVSSDRWVRCTVGLVAEEVAAAGGTTGEPVVTDLALDRVGDESSARHVVVASSSQGADVMITLDLVVFRAGRVLHSLLFASADLYPMPDGVVQRALRAAARA